MVMRVFPLEEMSAPRFPLEKSYSFLISFSLLFCSTTSRNQANDFTSQNITRIALPSHLEEY